MMLSILTKRLCPLMSLALAFGCGKKINDPKTSSGNSDDGTAQELPANFSLQINEAVSPVRTYKLEENAWFLLPAKLYAQNANAMGKQVKIYYNLKDSGSYEFSCDYKSLTSATELDFEKCTTSYGKDFVFNVTDLQAFDYPMDANAHIRMELINPSSTGIKIEAIYEVDWK